VIIVLICRYCCVFTNRMYFLLVCKIVVCMITPLVYHKTFRDVVIKMYVIIKKFYFPWICGCLYFKYGIYSEVNNILRRQINSTKLAFLIFIFLLWKLTLIKIMFIILRKMLNIWMHKLANKFYHQRRNSTHAIKLVEIDDHSLSIINISHHHHLIPFAGSIVSCYIIRRLYQCI